MVIDIGIGIDLAKIIILPYEFFFLKKIGHFYSLLRLVIRHLCDLATYTFQLTFTSVKSLAVNILC